MTTGPTMDEWIILVVKVTSVLLVTVLVTWGVLAAVRRRIVSKASGLENLDPLKQLLDKNKGVLTEEEMRLLRRKMAERILEGSQEDKKR